MSKIVMSGQNDKTPITYTYHIVNEYPHDRTAFTQGLLYHKGFLYESTGLRAQSSLRKLELETGKILKCKKLDSSYFAEGITLWQERLIQLTWKEKIGFVYDLETFELLDDFKYSTEGWGITHDGQRLIRSDGTNTLYFLDPVSFEEIGSLQICEQGKPLIGQLNELEYINGDIFANVLPPEDDTNALSTDRIAQISLITGSVLGWIDLTDLRKPWPDPSEGNPPFELNGIAYDPQSNRLFVTGKCWPELFEIELF